MAIQIIRNEAGNCILFRGSSNPVYFNACLSAQVDPNNPDLINVVNDIATAGSGVTEYEFYNIPYTEFRDANNAPFSNAQDTADYITLNGNVASITDVQSGYLGVWDASTNSPDLTTLTPNNGDWFYVGVAGTYNTVAYAVNDVVKYNDGTSTWELVPNETVRIDQLQQEVEDIVYSTSSPLFNTNAEVFADGDAGTTEPNDLEAGWYYRNGSDGVGKINWYYLANMNPENTMTLGTLGGMYAVIKVLATGVPYFSIYTHATGGSGDAAVWYRSRLTYFTEGVLDAHVGNNVLLYWGEDPTTKYQTIPHIELTLDEATSIGPAGTNEDILFGALSTSSNSPDGQYEFIAKAMGYKNNNHVREYFLDTNDPAVVAQTTDVNSNTSIDFTRDHTNTSVILSHDGSSFGVNTIKAVAEANGTISIKAIGDNGKDLVTNIDYSNVTVAGVSYSSISAAVNSLNALFTVNPYEVGYEPAVILPVTGDSLTSLNLQEGLTPTTGNPTHLYVVGADASSGHGARAWTNETIDRAGEYFNVKITGEGRFILGLVDTNNSADMAELANDSGNGHSGLYWGNAFYDYGSYTAPWTYYGNGVAGVTRQGWTGSQDQQLRYNSEVQDNFVNMDSNLFQVGIDAQGFIYVAYYDANRTNTFITTARTSLIAPAGDYALVVKLWNGNTTLVEAPTVRYLDEVSPAPTAVGDEDITIFGEGVTGNLASGVSFTATDGLKNDGFVSNDTISSAGEYFEFTWSTGGEIHAGLFSENDHTVAAMSADLTSWTSPEYIYYGARLLTSGFLSGAYREGGQSYTQVSSGANALYYGRAGFDTEGRATIWSSSDGVNWRVFHRANAAAVNGNYRFIAIAQTNGGSIDSLAQGQMSLAPVLSFRYIESPDGYYSYPLFATQEEADYYELQQTGNDNGSHTHVYPDDPTMSTWYMPATQHSMDTAALPSGSELIFQGNAITYTEIESLTNSDLAPDAFDLPDHDVNENSSVNIQIDPQDAGYTTTVSGLPTGLSYNLGYIQGTTSYVPRNESHTVTVTRTNSYGSSSDTFDINIDDNGSLGDLSGFTEIDGNFVQPRRIILDHDALLKYDTLLSPGQQLTYSFPQGVVPPTFGILSSTGDADATAYSWLNGDVLGSGSYDFSNHAKWDLRFVTFDGDVGGGTSKFNLLGWSDNSNLQGSSGANNNVEFKLEYSSVDNYIRLYRGGVLLKTSASAFAGDQTITLAGFDNQGTPDLYIPSDLAITNIGAGTTTAPTGFESPILEGEMGSLTLLGNTLNANSDAAAQFTQELEVNKRYIFPKSWVEANVLPYIDSVDEDVIIGVPVDGADLSDPHVDDFYASFRISSSGSESQNRGSYIQAGTGTPDASSVTVGSLTDAFYDYALEWDGTDLHVIACNINSINTEPGVASGGSFSRTVTYSGFATAHSKTNQSLTVVIAVDEGAQANLTTSGLQQVRIPWAPRTVLVGEASNGSGQFGVVAANVYDTLQQHAPSSLSFDPSLTLDAGQTYNFIYGPWLETNDYIEFRLASDNTTVYSTGVTAYDGSASGDPDFTSGYKGITFAVPADAPPLRLYFYNGFASAYDAGRPITISGSTYIEPITGITLEGPAANQTGNSGSNVADNGSYGWLSIDETLSAGERFVMNNDFLTELLAEMGDQYEIRIGLKGDNWDNTDQSTKTNSVVTGEVFKGNIQLRISKSSSNNIYFQIFHDGVGGSNSMLVNTTALHATTCAFIEITNSGDNIRMGFGRNGQYGVTVGSEATAAWDDWTSYKGQTGAQSYGITSLDVVFLVTDIFNGNNDDFNGSNVDWTHLSEVAIPSPAETNNTSWTKALDFSGSSERAEQVTQDSNRIPMKMAGTAQTVAPNAGLNVGHPWATACVFKSDGNGSNQHIWNCGEGAGSTDDNIYLRVDAGGSLYFGWGRQGALNEYLIATNLGSAAWYGVTVAHKGVRFSGADATNANLSSVLAIDLWYNSGGTWIKNPNTPPGTRTWTTTGGRMDRSITGSLTIGGRGSNRSFHGKVASFVTTTLRTGESLPSTAELTEMLTDPMRWLSDYKVGNPFRLPWQGSDSGFNFSLNDGSSAYSTQVWLMGDGTSDSYSNMIRNQVNPSDQNYTKLNMVSMVSNDIETVSIPGLT